MSSLSATVAVSFIIYHFFMAYFFLTPRFYRMLLGLGTNRNPRQDMANYASTCLAEGRITKAQLDRLGRWEACQQNAVENYPLFVTAMIFGILGKRSVWMFVALGLGYTGARIAYALAYILTENEMLSYVRSVIWWVGNVMCFAGIVFGAKGIES